MSDAPKTLKLDKRMLLIAAIATLALGVLLVLALHLAGVDLKKLALDGVAWCKASGSAVVEWARGLGPWVFFSSMAILPTFGFPLSPFNLSAGPVFAPQYGVLAVIAMVGVSLAINLALSYWIARYALRPFLAGLIRKFGYQLPEVARENERDLAILVRVTPGPPFFVQSYLLGLAEISFRTYMIVSWLVAMMYASSLVVFGDAILHGKGRNAFFSLMMFAGVVVGVKWLRKRARQKKEAQA